MSKPRRLADRIAAQGVRIAGTGEVVMPAQSPLTRRGDVVKLQGGTGSVCTAPAPNTTSPDKEIVMPQKRTTPATSICEHCGAEYLRRVHFQRFCTLACRNQQYKANGHGYVIWHDQTISAGTRGAISELMASLDLMNRGLHVFRAMSPACPCDLVVWGRSGRAVRIEVKTASRDKGTGRIWSGLTARSKNEFDVICYVMKDEIVYEPPIEEWGE